jgi:hypothetical protein
MSRFGGTSRFYYDPSATLGASGTTISLNQSQMPQYPFSEYRITDKVDLRNLNGDLTSFRNYNKAGYFFNWSFLDEPCAIEIKRMIDADPWVVYYPDGGTTVLGTFKINSNPRIEEAQFELYNLQIDLQEV